MSDWYPQEEGYIDDGLVVGFARAIGTINLHDAVFTTSPTSSTGLHVQQAATTALGSAVALKAAVTGDRIPVCFYGVVKIQVLGSVNEGDVVESDTVPTKVLPIQTISATNMTAYRGLNYTGTRKRLGYCLQGGVTNSEILVLVGRVS